VAVLLRNDHAFFEASFGAATLHAAPVPVNWHGKAEEVRFILEDSRAKVLVVHADLLAGVGHAVPDGVAVRVVETPDDVASAYGVDEPDRRAPAGTVEWSSWTNSFEPADRPLGNPLTTMIYTSGTTGRPKGVRRLPLAPDDPDVAT